MGEKQEIKGKMEVAGIMGPLWFTGWLFTIGFAKLTVGKVVVGLLVWPYYLGAHLGAG